MKKIVLFSFLLLNLTTQAATIYVNSSTGNDSSPGDGSSANPYKTFYKAYTVATTNDVIYLIGTFDWTSSDEIGDVASTGYTISKSITIQGEGPGSTFVQAASSANTADRRVFSITNGYTVTFKSLCIRYGRAWQGWISSTYYQYHGAAIGSAYGTTSSVNLTLTNVTIASNYSTTGAASGVYCEGTFAANRCTFENNTSTSGTSALNLEFTGGAQTVKNVTNCTFYNNTNSNNYGAFYIDRKGANIMNCTFIGNTIAVKTYALNANSTELYITNSILANSTQYDLYTTSGNANGVKVTNSIVEVESVANATSYTSCLTGDQANLNITTPTTNGGLNYVSPYLEIASNSVATNSGTTGTYGSTYSGGAIATPTIDQRNGTRSGTMDMGGFEYGATLPVQLQSFIAKKQNNHINLNWSTVQEINSKDFAVQHSANATAWNNIGNVIAAGNSSSLKNYSYQHNTPIKGNNYYRLLQRDLDGKTSFSDVRMVKFENKLKSITLFANPINNGVLQFQVNEAVVVSLLSSDGKLIWTKQLTNGTQTIDVSNYTKGLYLLKSNNETQKIVIE